MNKKTISKNISNHLNINQKLSNMIVNAFIKIVIHSLKDKDVKFSSFGTFYESKTPKRIGRNPKTKESYIIKSMTKIKFKASNKVRKTIN